MKRMTYTGESTANTAKTHALGTPGKTAWIDIKSLVVSTRAGNLGNDITIKIYDAAFLRWESVLRYAHDYGKDFSDIGMIKMDGAFTIVTSDPGVATGAIVVVSCVYNCYTSAEEAQLNKLN